MTTTISAICAICGTIGKSGKLSCCGLGGSWFRNCGASGNTQLRHTWSEGIRVCKTWVHSKTTTTGQQLNVGQHQRNSLLNGASMAMSTVIITAGDTPTFTSAKIATPMSDTTQMIASANTPANIATSRQTTMPFRRLYILDIILFTIIGALSE